SLALAALTRDPALMAELAAPFTANDPLRAKIPHAPGKAKNIIFLFMEGGPSHIDLFDPKPLLNKLAGKKLPDSFPKPITAMGEANSPLLECKRTWKQHGQSGLWMSDWLPHLSTKADELCVLRSCISDGINHAGGVCQMNTGSVFGGRPSLGAWVSYGLGTSNQNLPGFVVIKDNKNMVVNGVRSWGSGFMPSIYQGTLFEPGDQPILNLKNPKGVTDQRQSHKLNFLDQLNRAHQKGRASNTDLDARIRNYELAFRMQAEAPEAVDISNEDEGTRTLYGLDQKETQTFGRNCLMARRLVERGVRFVQLYHGAGSKWDSHDRIETNHTRLCKEMDQPVTALLTDLKQRGLLDETLVIWGGEFGRTPMSEKGDGRDHNPTGFTMWLAGGGIRGGTTIGETDELGLHAVTEVTHVHDFHSSILHMLGVDHTQLIYRYKGRPERIDQNEGHVLNQFKQWA
ncbi:MAG: DUF1501 domain-containing protein, partial [Verrucomicrobia bacterium]|nr:DUF1501 domain-containing protein [Verrucomicrobiota bacterium]